MNTHGIRSAIVLALVALSGAACTSDSPSPVGPDISSAATPIDNVSFARSRRDLSIASLQLASPYVSVNTGYTAFTVTVNNAGTKDVGDIYLHGDLKAQSGQSVPATAFLAYCPNPNGIVHPGDCVMSNGITGIPTLELGPGTYTLQILQQQANGSMKVLDSKTVDVLLVWTSELPR